MCEPITAIMKLLRYFLLNDSNKMRFASWMSAPFPPDIYFMTTRKSNTVFKAPHVSKGRTVNTTTDLSSSLQCAHAISASKSVCSVCWKWDFNVTISKLVTQPEVDGYILITDSLRGKTHLQSRIVLPTRINLLNMFTKICHI